MERADLRKYQRHSEVAELVLGEDAPLLGEIDCSKQETIQTFVWNLGAVKALKLGVSAALGGGGAGGGGGRPPAG